MRKTLCLNNFLIILKGMRNLKLTNKFFHIESIKMRNFNNFHKLLWIYTPRLLHLRLNQQSNKQWPKYWINIYNKSLFYLMQYTFIFSDPKCGHWKQWWSNPIVPRQVTAVFIKTVIWLVNIWWKDSRLGMDMSYVVFYLKTQIFRRIIAFSCNNFAD